MAVSFTEIADRLEQLATLASEVRQLAPQRNWIDEFRSGNVLTISQAAIVAAADSESVRRWAIAAVNTVRPLGIQVAGVWLLDAGELLWQIELRRGERARRSAEMRLAEHRKQRQQPAKLTRRIAG